MKNVNQDLQANETESYIVFDDMIQQVTNEILSVKKYQSSMDTAAYRALEHTFAVYQEAVKDVAVFVRYAVTKGFVKVDKAEAIIKNAGETANKDNENANDLLRIVIQMSYFKTVEESTAGAARTNVSKRMKVLMRALKEIKDVEAKGGVTNWIASYPQQETDHDNTLNGQSAIIFAETESRNDNAPETKSKPKASKATIGLVQAIKELDAIGQFTVPDDDEAKPFKDTDDMLFVSIGEYKDGKLIIKKRSYDSDHVTKVLNMMKPVEADAT